MKVTIDRSHPARLPWRASLTALASVLVAVLGLSPAPARAITRSTVLGRAHTWVAKKVLYSQRAQFAGYRRDCSGFVSMAWKLGRSYTSRTIHAVATHIPLSHLRPGDAVHTPGHVAIFVRWAGTSHKRYVAAEESSWGRPARQHVVKLGRGASGLRYKHIADDPAPVRPAVPAPLTGVSAPPTTSVDATPSIAATFAADATAAAPVLITRAAAALLAADAAPTQFLTSASQPAGVFALVPLY